jgi:hypothetical protein
MVEKGKDEDALKAAKVVLAASGVIERTSGVMVGVQVIVRQPGDKMSAEVVTVTTESGQ